jgi:DNA-binding CsgD family transcriptional regulator
MTPHATTTLTLAETVRGIASAGATNVEIAEFLGCSVDTLTRRIAEDLRKERAGIRISLRKAQIRIVLKGNVAMLIWLGKQMLDQSETTELSAEQIQQMSVEQLEAVVRGKVPAELDTNL